MIALIDNDDVDLRSLQMPHYLKAAEPRADDHDAVSTR